jgi:hypothetical protein
MFTFKASIQTILFFEMGLFGEGNLDIQLVWTNYKPISTETCKSRDHPRKTLKMIDFKSRIS